MKYFLKHDADMQSLLIEASGIINTDLAKDMVLATGTELHNAGLKRCFFDLANTHVDPDLTMTEMFTFINVFKQAGIRRSVKMAAFYATGGEYRLFLEKSADLQGYNLKHFTDRDKAVNWLCQ